MYIGQECLWKDERYRLVSVFLLGGEQQRIRLLESGMSVTVAPESPNDVTLILRPLSDMTEEEAAKIFGAAMDNGDFDGPWPNNLRITARSSNGIEAAFHTAENAQFIGVVSPLGVEIIRLEFSGEMQFSPKRSIRTFGHFTITKMALEMGFDLFDLIPSGLAVDATTLKNRKAP